MPELVPVPRPKDATNSSSSTSYTGWMPGSAAQAQMMVLWSQAPDSPRYNVPTLATVSVGGLQQQEHGKSVELGTLRQAVQMVMNRHEVLRTVLRVDDATGRCEQRAACVDGAEGGWLCGNMMWFCLAILDVFCHISISIHIYIL